jgi:hypothetical protein
MSLTLPYKQHHYMGEAASDAAILTWLRSNLWTHDGTGTGNPREGMLYFDTTIDKLKVYANGAWEVVVSGTGLDAAYTIGQTIDVDIADLAISFTGAYSFTVDLAGITGDVDGFFIEDTDNVEYIRATMNNTGLGIDWSADVRSIVFAAREDSSIAVDSADLTFSTTTTGNILIDSIQVLDIDAVGILSINSSGAAINIGNDIVNANIGIGTAGARTISVGSGSALAVNIDALTFSFDATTASNITVTGADLDMGTSTSGDVILQSAHDLTIVIPNLVDAVNRNMYILGANRGVGTTNLAIIFSDKIEIDSEDTSYWKVEAANLTLATVTSGILALESADAAVNAVDINAPYGGITADAYKAISLDAAESSNFTVTGADQDLTLAVVSGGAQQLFLNSAGTGVDALDINVTAGGFEIDAVKDSHIIVSGATADLTFSARNMFTDITLNEVGEEDLDASFTAASIIGCFNELKNGPQWMSGTTIDAATPAYTINEGDEYMMLHVDRTTAGPCAITFQSAWIAIDGNVICIKDTGMNSLANNITLLTQAAELFEGKVFGTMKSDSACWWIKAYNGNLYML